MWTDLPKVTQLVNAKDTTLFLLKEAPSAPITSIYWIALCVRYHPKHLTSISLCNPHRGWHYLHFAAAKSLQSCPTLCDLIDGSSPGSPIPGILQARTLEWVAISFSSAWKWKVKVKSLSRVWLLATPWTAAYQAPLSMGFSRQEYWSGVPLPSPLYLHFRDKQMETQKLCNLNKGK